MGSQRMVKLCLSGKLDNCKVTIIYRKYTWIDKQINWFFTCIYPIWPWCGCLHGYSIRYCSWCKQGIMDTKVKKITLWTQESKCRLVWSSKNWSRKEGLPSISSWPLFILRKRINYFNLCWWFYNIITHIRDNNIINWITEEWS